MDRRSFIRSGLAFGALASVCAPGVFAVAVSPEKGRGVGRVVKTEAEWKKILTPEQYRVTRLKGTEEPYSSPLTNSKARGTFACVCCGLALFSSKAKFDSGTGWPSFWAPVSKSHVREEADRSLPEERVEVVCARCDAHLGHVFDDGPEPTGLRYCMNGVALRFVAGR